MNIQAASDLPDSEYQRHAQWMEHALLEAERASNENEVPVGAVLVLDDHIIGRGYNQPIRSHNPCAHAEILALQAAAIQMQNYRLPGASLYVTLEPCTMCWGALIHARIDHLIYGASEFKSGALTGRLCLHESPAYNHRMAITQGVLESECSTMMSRLFARRRAEKKQADSSSN